MPPLEAEPFLHKLVAKHLHMISRGNWTCSCEKLCDDSDRHFSGVLEDRPIATETILVFYSRDSSFKGYGDLSLDWAVISCPRTMLADPFPLRL